MFFIYRVVISDYKYKMNTFLCSDTDAYNEYGSSSAEFISLKVLLCS